MSEIGYISSFDEVEGFGFIRPAEAMHRVVKFSQSDVDEDMWDSIAVGQEVGFTRDPNAAEHDDWDVAASVEISVEPDGDAGTGVTVESDPL